MATNPYEASARQNKAFALASHLHQYEVKVHEVRSITQEQWKAIADLMTTLRRCLDADAPASTSGYSLTCASGSYTIAGQAAGTLAGRKLAAAQGTYTLTGSTANLIEGHVLTCAQDSYM